MRSLFVLFFVGRCPILEADGRTGGESFTMRDSALGHARPVARLLTVGYAFFVLALVWLNYFHAPVFGSGIQLAPFKPPIVGRYHVVLPGPAAQRAGIRRGDVVRTIGPGIPIIERWRSVYGARKGTPLKIYLERHGRIQTLTVPANVELPTTFGLSGVLTVFVGSAALLLAGFIGYRRPGIMSVALITFISGILYPTYLVRALVYLPDVSFVAIGTPLVALIDFFPNLALASFAIRFPYREEADQTKATAIRIVDAVVLGGYLIDLPRASLTFYGFGAFLYLCAYLGFAAIVVFASSLYSYFKASRSERPRVVILFSSIVAAAIVYVFGIIAFQLSSPRDVSVLQFGVCTAVSVVLVGVSYAILRHHVFGIRFVFNRTIVVAAIGALLAATCVFLSWFFTNYLTQTRWQIAVSILVALVLGWTIRSSQSRLVALVDLLFFSTHRRLMDSLRDVRSQIEREEMRKNIETILTSRVCDVLGLSSGAIFSLAHDDGFLREQAFGWPRGTTWHLLRDDSIATRLLECTTSFLRTDELAWDGVNVPAGVSCPVLIVPLRSRRKIVALLVCGAHSNGDDIDPDEARALVEVCASAAPMFEPRQLRQVASLAFAP